MQDASGHCTAYVNSTVTAFIAARTADETPGKGLYCKLIAVIIGFPTCNSEVSTHDCREIRKGSTPANHRH